MLLRMLVVACLTSACAHAQIEPLCTTSGRTADSLIAALPRDSTTWTQLGILYTNKVFLRESTRGQEDADSAIACFERALHQDRNPRVQAYYAVARALRAKHDGVLTKAFGSTKDRVKHAFRDALRLAQDNPHDLGVLFLVANLLQEGDPLDDAEKYWKRSWEYFARLSDRATDTAAALQAFFTPETRANILLNQGKLIRKLVADDAVAKYLARERWLTVIQQYPETLAAKNAREQISKL